MVATIEPRYYETGDVARALGVSTEAVRKWERVGIIVPPLRTASGKRLFTEADVEAMRQAQQARETGSRTLLETA